MPHRVVASNVANGDIVTKVKEVKFDVEIPESVFEKPAKNLKRLGRFEADG